MSPRRWPESRLTRQVQAQQPETGRGHPKRKPRRAVSDTQQAEGPQAESPFPAYNPKSPTLPKWARVQLRLAPLPSPRGRGPCLAGQPQTALRLPAQPPPHSAPSAVRGSPSRPALLSLRQQGLQAHELSHGGLRPAVYLAKQSQVTQGP